jgi:hypothetical protein
VRPFPVIFVQTGARFILCDKSQILTINRNTNMLKEYVNTFKEKRTKACGKPKSDPRSHTNEHIEGVNIILQKWLPLIFVVNI